MNKDLLFRKHPLVAALFVVAAAFAVLFALYGLTHWTSQGQVMGRVLVAGVPIGGLTEDEANTALRQLEADYQGRDLTFDVLGNTVSLVGAQTGLTLDVEEMVDHAMSLGREGNFAYQFLWWLRHAFKTIEIEPSGSTDPRMMTAVFEDWDERIIGQPPGHGGIEVQDGKLVAIPPVRGTGIDREQAARVIEETVLAPDPQPVVIPTEEIIPVLTEQDIDTALLEARAITGSSIVLRAGENEITFTPEQLVEAYIGTTVTEGIPGIAHSFDPEVINRFLEPLRSQYEASPVDARFEIVGDEVRIIRGSFGTRIDENEAVAQLLQASRQGNRRGILPIVEGARPTYTSEDLEAMGIKHLVSQFTTYHDCCQNRVTNIQLMADTVSMARIAPGGRFDLNAYVGPRTEAKGYLPAPTIIGRELVDTVGGGVSQFATTLYNAVFWGGYHDIEHRPHTVWFNRYPEGIEATVNWGGPELIFANNTDKHILIHTRYTGTSITVRIFGDNDGRIVRGEQRNGQLRMTVVEPGGPNARIVEGEVSPRFNPTQPPPPQYVASEGPIGVDQVITRQSEREGWSVTVTRTITQAGQVINRREWTVVYLPQRAIYEVHRCKVPGSGVACPEPPTTTTTTTTLPEGDGDD